MLRWWIETHSFKHGRTRSWLAVNFQIFAKTYRTLSSEVASLTSQNILKICHIFQNVRSCSSRALSGNSDTKADSSEGRRMRARSTSSLNCNPHMLLLLLLLLLLTPNEVLKKTDRENPGGRRPRFAPPESPEPRKSIFFFARIRREIFNEKKETLLNNFEPIYPITPRRIHERIHLQVQDVSIFRRHHGKR